MPEMDTAQMPVNRFCVIAEHFQKRFSITFVHPPACAERAKSKKNAIFAFIETFSGIGAVFGSRK
jgi:hypothetical protein